MAEEGKQISFKELVDVRREEMQSMLPGFMAEVRGGGDKLVRVYSPNAFEKSSLKVRGMSDND